MTVAYIVNPKICPVQPMHIRVDDKGFTRADPAPQCSSLYAFRCRRFLPPPNWPTSRALAARIERRQLLTTHYPLLTLLNKKSRQRGALCRPNDAWFIYAGFCTFAAWGPFGPWTISNSTASPSCKVR